MPDTSLDGLTEEDFEGAEITDEMEAALNEHMYDADKQKRREKRRSDCGRWSYYFDPHTGKHLSYTFKCGHFRDCIQCRTHRAQREFGWLLSTLEYEDRLLMFEVTHDDAEMLIRQMLKKDYVRYPQSDTEIVIVREAETTWENGQLVNKEWLQSQNWLEIVNTPEGRNKSGSLHVPRNNEKVDKFSFILMKYFTTDAPHLTAMNAMNEATNETKEFAPKTPDQVKSFLDERVGIATHKLTKLGFLVTTYVKQAKVEHDKINWVFSDSIIKYNTRNFDDYAHEIDVGLQNALVAA